MKLKINTQNHIIENQNSNSCTQKAKIYSIQLKIKISTTFNQFFFKKKIQHKIKNKKSIQNSSNPKIMQWKCQDIESCFYVSNFVPIFIWPRKSF